jgi:hypothetical protein
MNDRDYSERQQLRSTRAESGYTSARLSAATIAKLRELLRAVGVAQVYGLDELLYELAVTELQRRQVRVAVVTSEQARVARAVAQIRKSAAKNRPHSRRRRQ